LHQFKVSQSGDRLPEYMVEASMPADKAAVVHGIDGLLQLIPKAREALLGSLPLLGCRLLGQVLKDRFSHCPVERI
jgi:hypothetical protein